MFQKHIEEFNENINSLRDFVNTLDDFLSEKVSQHEKIISPILQLGFLNTIIEKKDDWKDGEKEKIEKELEEASNKLSELFGEKINFANDLRINIEKEEISEGEGERDNEDQEEGIVKHKLSLKIKSPKDVKIDEHFKNIGKMQNHINNLYKTSFISLLSSVEWFFSQILHFYYDKHPNASGIQKKTLTLSELKTFGSIEDAEKYLVDVKIEDILRNSFDGWINLLKSELNLNLSYINPIEKELIEFYQRRNLLVHNGGIVNSIYISKVNEVIKQGVTIGTELKVEKDYLNNAISKLQIAFILIASELWKSLDKNDKTRGDVLGAIVYENLLESNWDLCESLTYFIKNDAKLEVADKLVATLNHWLSKKRKGEFEKIKKELSEADYSDKKEIFQLGLYALLEDKENFFETLPSALDSRQLNLERLEAFPIFKEMRECEEYEKFKEETKYFKQPNQEIAKI